jgi:hypothetical protein
MIRPKPEEVKPSLSLDDLAVCSCGRVWHLEKMKDEQHDWNKYRQDAKCSCGSVLWRSEDD